MPGWAGHYHSFPMTVRTGQLAVCIALLVSLVLHLSAFGLVRTIRDWRESTVTESRSPEVQPDLRPEDPPPPDEDEFKPGIEEGAPAVVTWIGYDEYKEHLARLANTDQAAFTSAIAKGIPESNSEVEAPPQQTPPTAQPTFSPPPVETTAKAVEPPLDVTKIDEPNAGQAAPPAPEIAEVQPPIETAPVESLKVPEQASEQVVPEPLKIEPAESHPAEATPTEQAAQKPVESEQTAEPTKIEPEPQEPTPLQDPQVEPAPEVEPSLLPTTVPTPIPGIAPTPVSTPQGEPVARDSERSDKDSPATSTKQVPESKWDNGQPLAAEGMELRPYSLYRHITWDSHDIMFAQQLNRGRWEGRVLRNPIVSMRFDRHGRVGEVRIIRPSGYAPLDQLYLKSWIARWTAADERLAKLGPDELTNPIQMKIIFIDEPRPMPADDKANPNKGS